jgi:hypothetical protein
MVNYDLKTKPSLNLNYIRNPHAYVGVYPKNITDFINLLVYNKPVFMNLDQMYNIISYFLNRDINNIFSQIISLYNCNNKDKKLITSIVEKSDIKKYFFLDKCIFVVKDGDVFIKTIKDTINSNVNQGINKLKTGHINSLINALSSLDNDFRNSLYRHNSYHYQQGNISRDDLIPRSKFDFKNIHGNLGSVP